MLPFIPRPLPHPCFPFILYHSLLFKNLNAANRSSASLDIISREDGRVKRTRRYTLGSLDSDFESTNNFLIKYRPSSDLSLRFLIY